MTRTATIHDPYSLKVTLPPDPAADPDTASDSELFGATVALEGAQAEQVRQIAVGADPTAWPDPGTIYAPLKPVPYFDADTLLPPPLAEWVVDEASRMPCPPDFVAAAVIASLGSIIGARCAIKPKGLDDWLVVPNLWGGIVGLPSAKKSPAISNGLRPLDRLVAKAMKEHAAAMDVYESECVVHKVQTEAIEANLKRTAKKSNGSIGSTLTGLAQNLQSHKQQTPTPPNLRRYKTNDTTVEKLGELLRSNPAGLLVHRDELVGLLASWEKEGHEGDRAFFLELWNGTGSFDTDRIGRGSIFIENLCGSIFGGTQPDKLIAYLEQASNALANDGMLQRFQLLVYPDPVKWEWIDRTPNKQARDRAFEIFEALADIDFVEAGAAPADDFHKFPFFRFNAGAQKIFIEWSTDLHGKKIPTEDSPIIQQHLAKFDKLFPAIALIFHLVEAAYSGIGAGKVNESCALRAAAWCDYLEAHARRCYGLLADDGLRAAQALAGKITAGKLTDGFTAREVRRNRWRNLSSDESVHAALDWLEDEGWLRSKEVGGIGPGTGRRTFQYFINPKVNNRELA